MGSSQQFSLRWNNYLRHITGAFDSLRTDEDLVDVTLSCEGKKIRAHKMLLSACSSYFRELFKDNPCQHPVIIFRDVKYQDLEALIDFMYQGEVNVVQEQLTSFLNTAELLAVQGLTDNSSKDGAESDTSDIKTSEDSLPATKPEVKALPASITPSPISIAPAVTTSSINNSRGRPGSPVAKRRKCSLGGNNISKEDSATNDLESLEVIPVIPNVKVEQPDYYEQERDGQYSDSVREHSVISGNLDSFAQEDKKDSSDTYNSNSSEKGQHSNPLLDINHVVMGVSGPSLDTLPQEPLQGHWMDCWQDGKEWARHSCEECGATYKHLRNLRAHLQLHMGKTQCKLCNKVLCNRSYFRKHLLQQHGITGDQLIN